MSKGRGCLPFPDGGSILSSGQDLLLCVLPVILGIRRSASPVGHFSAVSTGGGEVPLPGAATVHMHNLHTPANGRQQPEKGQCQGAPDQGFER